MHEKSALPAENDSVDKVWGSCKKSDRFCPIALHKFNKYFWSAFVILSIAAVVLNLLFDQVILMALYAYPVVYLSLIRLTMKYYILFGILTLSSALWLVSIDPLTIGIVISYALLMIIVKRFTYISNQNFKQRQDQEDLFMDTMLSLSKTIDTRDPYTAFHSNNVSKYAYDIAKEMGLSQLQADAVRLAGLIHDIGKIGTPENILRKESRLDEEEYEIMKLHPQAGYDIIMNMKRLQELGITDMVRHHHERIDGKGYPLNLNGVDIPLGARILGVADAFDAMTTNRSYRQKLATETAAEELKRFKDIQFDPKAADALIRVLINQGKLPRETIGDKFQQPIYAN